MALHRLHRVRSLTHTHYSCVLTSTASATTAFPPSPQPYLTSDVIYVNPSHPSDAYDIVNSKHKPCIPALGFGTWGNDHYSHETMAQAVDYALSIGYRHLDCARVWDNEKLRSF